MKVREELCKLEAAYGNTCESLVKADANEAYYSLLPKKMDFSGNDFNRYPDSDAIELRDNLAKFYGIKRDNILMNNGSSHVLEMVFSAYCKKGDRVVTFYPGFSMFENYAIKAGVNLVWIDTKDFVQDMDVLIEKVYEVDPVFVLICNPNNPTGYVNSRKEILKVVREFPNKLIIVDEAYSDFSPEISVLKDIEQYENLVVTKTMSKALGLANLRIGYIAGNIKLIKDLWRVKLPYNISGATLKVANKIFENINRLPTYVEEIKKGRNFISQELEKLGIRVFFSGTNFVLARSPIYNMCEKLLQRGILVRHFTIYGEEYFRITVMDKEDNKKIITTIKEVLSCENQK